MNTKTHSVKSNKIGHVAGEISAIFFLAVIAIGFTFSIGAAVFNMIGNL